MNEGCSFDEREGVTMKEKAKKRQEREKRAKEEKERILMNRHPRSLLI